MGHSESAPRNSRDAHHAHGRRFFLRSPRGHPHRVLPLYPLPSYRPVRFSPSSYPPIHGYRPGVAMSPSAGVSTVGFAATHLATAGDNDAPVAVVTHQNNGRSRSDSAYAWLPRLNQGML